MLRTMHCGANQIQTERISNEIANKFRFLFFSCQFASAIASVGAGAGAGARAAILS